MATPKIYSATGLTGGTTGSLDSINGSLLNDGDKCLTINPSDGKRYWHYLDADSGETESSPNIISPDANAGTKRWKISGIGQIDVHDHTDIDGGGTIDFNDLDNVSFASASDINTGTSTSAVMTPDAFAASLPGTKVMIITVFPYPVTPTIGDAKIVVPMPLELNGYNIVNGHIFIFGSTLSGTTTVQVRRFRQSTSVENDVFSTAMIIDSGETSSYTAASQPVINTSYDDILAAIGTAPDHLLIDVDGVSTNAAGLYLVLSFRLP